ncbi:MAG: hypothetical protein PVI11_04570 [Candidatus Aminicenantes bacterium]|jgi:hypothetical protein
MDAYLSREARQILKALSLVSSNSKSDGFLIGHRRGHRLFVEKILPSREGFFPSLKKYHELEELFEGQLIGFFSFRLDEKKMSRLLAPHAYGKLFLEIKLIPQKKLAITPYVVDYEKDFFLRPIKLKKSR